MSDFYNVLSGAHQADPLSPLKVHSGKLLNSDWPRGVQMNSKLYSPGVPICFLYEVDTKFSEINRLRKATIKHPKTSELFSEVDPKTSEYSWSWPEDVLKLTRSILKASEVQLKNFEYFPTLDRRASKVSEVNTNRSEEIHTKPITFWLVDRNFVEYTINKNRTTFSYNSWLIGTRGFQSFQIA